MDTNQILPMALAAVPTMLTVLVGILINNARLNDLKDNMNAQFKSVDSRFDGVDRRFDEARDLWRSELYRVEQVIDARLKHLEERG